MASSGMLRRVTLVRTDVSEELSASFIRVAKIGQLGTTLAVTTTDARSEEIPSISSQRASVASYG
jgi:DNA-binding TFAR19-related protein (PDSD5 family)